MDSFAQQDHARRRTRRLYVLFGLAVVVVATLFHLALAPVVYSFRQPVVNEAWWNPMTVLITTCLLLVEAPVHPLHFLKLIWDARLVGWVALAIVVSTTLARIIHTFVERRGGGRVRRLETMEPDESAAHCHCPNSL